MANLSKESITTRIAVAVLCMLISIMWGLYRGQQFLDVVDHIIASFGGLVPGAILVWIIWQTTQSTKIPAKSNSHIKHRVRSIKIQFSPNNAQNRTN